MIGIQFSSLAQEDLKKQVLDLEKKVLLLQKNDSLLRKSINIEDSLSFYMIRNSIINAVDNAPKLSFDFNKVIEDIEKDELWTKLVDANNPSSDILGSSFVEVVTKAAETHFLNALERKDKIRFTDIVTKIIKNPIISSVLKSNPITSIVASITNSASDFFSNTVTGTKISNLAIDTKNVFDQAKLDAFNKELAPYIHFYDEMIFASENYNQGLMKLKAKNIFLTNDITNYNNDLLKTLGINSGTSTPKSTQANDMFKLTHDKYGFPEYKKITSKSNIKNTKIIADKMIVYQIQVKDFKDEYTELLENYLNTNVDLLNKAKNISLSKGFDTNKIDKLITSINSFISKRTPIKKNIIIDESKSKVVSSIELGKFEVFY